MGSQVHVLRFLKGKYRGEEFPLGPDKKNFVVGRSSDVDLVLADDAVSRKHARIYGERGRMWLRDLGSRNGTSVNGDPISRHCLREGDRVVIGASLIAVAITDSSQVRAGWAGERKTSHDAASSSKSMSGSISDIPLVDVLQWLGTSRKTGTLVIRNQDDQSTGHIYLREGMAFYATINANEIMEPEKALIRMLSWSNGNFGLENVEYEGTPPKEIKTSLGHVLMEAARQNDEIEHLAERYDIPRYNAEVSIARPSKVRWRELKHEDLDLIQDLAEGRSWAWIMDTYSEDDLKLTKRMVDLNKRGLVTY